MLAIITSLLLANAVPGAVPAEELAPAIIYTAARHKVDPVLLTRIILVESGGIANAYNKSTQDHGLAQINEKTRITYGLSKWCLDTWQCNLDAAAMILADMWRIKGSRMCVYNMGPRGRFLKNRRPCEKYEEKLLAIN